MNRIHTSFSVLSLSLLIVSCSSGTSNSSTTTSATTEITTTTVQIVALPSDCEGKYVFNMDLPLKPCDEGMGVESVQSQLSNDGFQVELDGYYGKGTETAVRQYQAAHGLPVTGIVDFETYRKLGTFYAGTDINGDGVVTPNEFIAD